MRLLYLIGICIVVLIVVHTSYSASENYTNTEREPITHETIKRDDGLCSSNRQHHRSCDMHLFHQHAHFKKKLDISGEIYVCKAKPYPACNENTVHNWVQGGLWNNFNTLNDVISKGLKTGLSRQIAENLMRGGLRRKQTLMERHKVLKQKQKNTRQVLDKNENEINKIKSDIRDLGKDLWEANCLGTMYASYYEHKKQPRNLEARKNLCYDAYWLR